MKLKNLILEQDSGDVEDFFTTQRSPKERAQNKKAADLKRVKQYIKDGFKGDLDLRGTELKELPAELTEVNGNLNLFKSKIEKLPDELTRVNGNLRLNDSNIKELPDALKTINGHLQIDNTDVKILPDNLTVEWLYADSVKLTSFPKNLTVNDTLSIRFTEVPTIPSDLNVYRLDLEGSTVSFSNSLEVKDELDLYNTKIAALPNTLKVRKNLILAGSTIKRLPDNLSVGRDIRLRESDIISVDNLPKVINERLDLSLTGITSLPDDLYIGHNLVLNGSDIESLPDNLEVEEYLYANQTKIDSIPNNLKVNVLVIKSTPLSRQYIKDDIKQMIFDNGGRVNRILT